MSDATHGQVTADAAEIYEAFFLPALFDQWPGHVLDAGSVQVGDRVLDVGCGTGVLARAAARRVGPSGAVTGVDPNEGMLAVARRAPEPVSWTQGAAEALPFSDGQFDRMVSQFAIMFFSDRPMAISEFARVTRPGGTIALAVWASLAATPGYAAVVELLDDLFGADAADALASPYQLGDADAMRAMLEPAFADVRVEQAPGTARFDSIDDWVRTDVRGWTLADAIDDVQYQRLLAEAHVRLARFADSEGRIAFDAPALIATGVR